MDNSTLTLKFLALGSNGVKMSFGACTTLRMISYLMASTSIEDACDEFACEPPNKSADPTPDDPLN